MEKIQIKELKVKKFNVPKNALLQNYVSKRPNNIICIDTLFLTKKSCIFFTSYVCGYPYGLRVSV